MSVGGVVELSEPHCADALRVGDFTVHGAGSEIDHIHAGRSVFLLRHRPTSLFRNRFARIFSFLCRIRGFSVPRIHAV